MLLRLVSTKPFTKLQKGYNKITKSTLDDIHFFISLEKLFYPNKTTLYNTKPILHLCTFKTPILHDILNSN